MQPTMISLNMTWVYLEVKFQIDVTCRASKKLNGD